MSLELNKIICGDALEVLRTFPNESVDMIMTSPPYYGLRDYGIEGQLGLEKTFDDYLEKVLAITQELKRVLKKEGNLFWNHGDSYSTGHEAGTTDKKKGWKQDKGLSKNENRGRAFGGSIPTKSLMGQPWRLAIAMIDRQGWILRSDIKWIKQILLWKERKTIGSVMPTSVNDRFNASGEYLFHFVKNKKYFFNLDAIKIKTAESNKDRPRMGQRNPNGTLVHDYQKEWEKTKERDYGDDDSGARRSRTKAGLRIHKENNQPEGRAHFQTGKALHDYYKNKGILEPGQKWKVRNDDFGEGTSSSRTIGFFSKIGVQNGIERYNDEYKKNIPNAWLIQTKPGATGNEYHSARYPLELCEIPILTACPEKGIVLDPFIGSGTTAVAAKMLGRNYIGIEKNPEYVKIANSRLKQDLLL